MASVVPAGMGLAGGFSAAAVLADEITGSDTLAGLAAACTSVGGALATVPLARYMAARGRRPGLAFGWLLAAMGAVICFFAAVLDFYPLLPLGLTFLGMGSATTLSARYAASDLATENQRARAIGFLVWASTVGSVLGPSLALGPAGWLAKQIGLPELAGPYVLAAIVFVVAAAFVDRQLRPDPLEVIGQLGRPASERPAFRESVGKLWSNPAARLAVFAMAVGQAVMVGIMTMTPLHMKDGDHELRIIGLVISLHILGMYAFSPIVGWLVDRVGPNLIIAVGGITLFLGAELAAHTDAEDRTGVFIGLFLIGIGWSFGLVAGSSLLTGAVPLADRVAVQGVADLVMVGAGAGAGITGGFLKEAASYHAMSHWSGVFALVLVLAGGVAAITARRGPQAGLQVG